MTREPPTRAAVCAVVVTYHPDDGFESRLARVLGQVAAAVIVDNGSQEAALHAVQAAARSPAVTLICNGNNLGIARALNLGVDQAAARGFTWALLLDQDTLVDPDMVERLQGALASAAADSNVAAIGCKFRDTQGRKIESLRLNGRGSEWEEVQSIITSGTLLSLRAHALIGPFRDEFFIDYVDTEYCFRARRAGFIVIETVQPLMEHTFGTPTGHTLFGSTTWTTNHSPDRRYYIARNNTVLLREYGTAGRGPWLIKSIVRSLRTCKRIAYFERDKLSKIYAVATGWWDGVRGRLGPRYPR